MSEPEVEIRPIPEEAQFFEDAAGTEIIAAPEGWEVELDADE